MKKSINITLISIFLTVFSSTYISAQDVRGPIGFANPAQIKILEAEYLIKSGKLDEAARMLTGLLRVVPADWRPATEKNGTVFLHFWDDDEFNAYKKYIGESSGKKITWITPSYSKAYYLLAHIYAEKRNPVRAEKMLRKAEILEPDNPYIYSEKGYLTRLMHNPDKAYHYYAKALTVRPWMSDRQKALALRGAGSVMIDMNHLDKAEKLFKKSLELEPDSMTAKNELEYIKNTRESYNKKYKNR